ncbi:tetratricopeptide (TPR) repeat protein [Nocardioides sp. BE266]|uniref:CHAT domain-containing protein n=1 Tax=Nocardioides sp. BE266 TaxID=2817725 RepID=UPI002866B5A7|nr:CHAT domain-containing protein [Nocardioides sp. BE266]MDR7252603.1 tetratricopeptide (TPR) repeat protein [Nocardioides sp. BE266]
MQRGLVFHELHRLVEAEASHSQALRTLAATAGDPLLEGDVHANRAMARISLADWQGARADLDDAARLYLSLGHLGRTAMVDHNRGTLEALRGDLPAALVAFDAAADRYRLAGVDPGLLDVERAEALLGAGLADEAQSAARAAIDRFAAAGNRVDIVQARLTLAEAALLAGDHDLAATEADLARTAARQQRRPRWAALAGHLRLRARHLAGERGARLLGGARRTSAELAAADWPVHAADARLVAALVALDLGRHDEARAELASVRRHVRSGPAELRARAHHAEALWRRTSGDPAGAARAVRSGLRVLDELQAVLGASDLRAHAAAHTAELARLGVELAVDRGDARGALAAAERARAGSLRFRSARPPDDEALVADLAALREVEAEIAADGAPSAALLARRAAVEVSVRDRARHAAARPEALPPAGSAEALTGLVDALGDRTLVELVEAHGQVHAVVVHGGRHRLETWAPLADLQHQVQRLQAGLQWLTAGRASPAVLRLVDECARRLDDVLPVGAVGATAAPLVVVPSAGLASVPWSMLPSCAGRAITVAPSAALWSGAASARAPRTGGVLLAHGPGLAHAAAEIRAVGQLRPDAVRLTGSRARADAVLASMDGTVTTHLATHGIFRADNPMFSQLQLVDGPLTVYDIERLRRAPAEVILASCDSARWGVVGGEQVLGLAAVLLSLGTRTVVAATMPVPDAASRRLMVRLHHHLAEQVPMALALARARADLLGSRGYRDPAAIVAAAGYECLGAG